MLHAKWSHTVQGVKNGPSKAMAVQLLIELRNAVNKLKPAGSSDIKLTPKLKSIGSTTKLLGQVDIAARQMLTLLIQSMVSSCNKPGFQKLYRKDASLGEAYLIINGMNAAARIAVGIDKQLTTLRM